MSSSENRKNIQICCGARNPFCPQKLRDFRSCCRSLRKCRNIHITVFPWPMFYWCPSHQLRAPSRIPLGQNRSKLRQQQPDKHIIVYKFTRWKVELCICLSTPCRPSRTHLGLENWICRVDAGDESLRYISIDFSKEPWRKCCTQGCRELGFRSRKTRINSICPNEIGSEFR